MESAAALPRQEVGEVLARDRRHLGVRIRGHELQPGGSPHLPLPLEAVPEQPARSLLDTVQLLLIVRPPEIGINQAAAILVNPIVVRS